MDTAGISSSLTPSLCERAEILYHCFEEVWVGAGAVIIEIHWQSGWFQSC